MAPGKLSRQKLRKFDCACDIGIEASGEPLDLTPHRTMQAAVSPARGSLEIARAG